MSLLAMTRGISLPGSAHSPPYHEIKDTHIDVAFSSGIEQQLPGLQSGAQAFEKGAETAAFTLGTINTVRGYAADNTNANSDTPTASSRSSSRGNVTINAPGMGMNMTLRPSSDMMNS